MNENASASEDNQLDFSSPASIFAFTKKLFTQLSTLDQKTNPYQQTPTNRSEVFRDKIFQRFSLLYYYNHALAEYANKISETHAECGQALEAQ